MSAAFSQLLDRIDVCIISGGRFEQFQEQALKGLTASEEGLERLHLMPTCGTRYYRWVDHQWHLEYAEDLTDDEISRTEKVLEEGAKSLGLWEDTDWGPKIENRGSQVTFSALGQSAPVDAKTRWDPDGAKKRALQAYAQPLLPDLEVRGGGSTSIDVTRKGIDKAYGIRKLVAQLDTDIQHLLFIGDRLDETGNDFPVFELGVPSIDVDGWPQTLEVVNRVIAWLDTPGEEFPLPVLQGPAPA